MNFEFLVNYEFYDFYEIDDLDIMNLSDYDFDFYEMVSVRDYCE